MMIEVTERHENILVVDDDAVSRMTARAMLETAGYRVEEATDGAEALEAFQSHPAQLVVLDVVMPGMDGFEACRSLRKLPDGRFVPVLMATGLDDPESIQRAFEAGATDFIPKPLNNDLLAHRVRYMLRSSDAFSQLRLSQARLLRAQRVARLGYWDYDIGVDCVHCSAETCHLLGMPPDRCQLTFDEFLQHVPHLEQERFRALLNEVQQGRSYYEFQYPVMQDTKDERILHTQVEVVRDDQDQAIAFAGTVQDVTALRRAEERIRYLAFYDHLTGLANRMLFREKLEQTLDRACRQKDRVALMFMDVDRFKRINDTLGHPVGDVLLKMLSKRLLTCIRRSDCVSYFSGSDLTPYVSRHGGDEFTLLLDKVTCSQDAARVARRILDALEEIIELDGYQIQLTASIGISVYPDDGQDASTLLKNADTALYGAKDAGRNTFRFYESSMNETALRRLKLENELLRAVEKKELVLYYQPLVDSTSTKVVAAEALVRWNHPKKGVIPPGDFIPIAEESGFISEISGWVLQQACQDWVAWRDAGLPPIRISVNISGQDFLKYRLFDALALALEHSGMTAEYLEMEITESVLLDNRSSARDLLERLKQTGVRIAIDDFGTGYSSLSYLKAFPIDTLKIDRSFVDDLLFDENDTAITQAIIGLGHTLGMEVVAEGVETREQHHYLQQSGCQILQGFLFSHPLPEKEFIQLLQQQ